MIYLDSAATTLQKPPQVSRAVLSAMQHCGSVGRGGHQWAMRGAQVVYDCRVEAGALFDAEPEQVVFTMNATHGLNIAIRSLCREKMPVVISGFEHNAVTRPLYALGAKVTVAGRELFAAEQAVEDFRRALEQGAELAVCSCCSNVYGYVLPYMEIARLCRSYGVPLILDASQAAGSFPLSLKESGAAFIAMPGHKGLYGPQGTGILLCGTEGEPLMHGGTGSHSLELLMPKELPDRLEAGTHNVCGIAGLREGLRYVRKRQPQRILEKERRLLKLLIGGLREENNLRLFTGKGQSAVLSLVIDNKDCQEAAQLLARHAVGVRAGLHCAPLAHESGKTLHGGTVRLSLSDFNTEAEIRRLLSLWKKLF